MRENISLLGNYLLFFVPTLIVLLLLWFFLVDGKLFYCSDTMPGLDFIPPFVHGKQVGDYLIVPAFILYSVWIVFILAIVLLPAYLTQKHLVKKKK